MFSKTASSLLMYIPLIDLGCLMFSSLLATMHFHSILFLSLFYIGPNCLRISSSRFHGGLPSGNFWSLIYLLTSTWVHLLSVNLVTYSTQWNFCFWYSIIRSFGLFLNYHFGCSPAINNIPSISLSFALCVVYVDAYMKNKINKCV